MMSTHEPEQPWLESPADEPEDDRPWVIDEDTKPSTPPLLQGPEVVHAAVPEREDAVGLGSSSSGEGLPEPWIDLPLGETDDPQDDLTVAPPEPVHHIDPKPLVDGARPANRVDDSRFDATKTSLDIDPARGWRRPLNILLVATTIALSVVVAALLVNKYGDTPTETLGTGYEPQQEPANKNQIAGKAVPGIHSNDTPPTKTPPPREPSRTEPDPIPPPREKLDPSLEEETPTFELKHTKPRPGQLESKMALPPERVP